MTPLYVWGAGGHGKVVADILHSTGLKENAVTGFIDIAAKSNEIFGLPVRLEKDVQADEELRVVVAIGVNETRARIVNKIRSEFPAVKFVSAIHPTAIVAKSCRIGVGTVVAAGAILGPDTEVGEFAVVNSGASVDHDCVVGAFASVAPGAILGGGVRLGEMAYVGLGAHLIHGVEIGSETVIGAGSVVVRSIGANQLAFGSPCRIIRSRKAGDRYL